MTFHEDYEYEGDLRDDLGAAVRGVIDNLQAYLAEIDNHFTNVPLSHLSHAADDCTFLLGELTEAEAELRALYA